MYYHYRAIIAREWKTDPICPVMNRSPVLQVDGETAYYTSQRVSKRLHLAEKDFPQGNIKFSNLTIQRGSSLFLSFRKSTMIYNAVHTAT